MNTNIKPVSVSDSDRDTEFNNICSLIMENLLLKVDIIFKDFELNLIKGIRNENIPKTQD